MTPVASERNVYETLTLALRRNIKRAKVLTRQVSSYASRGVPHTHATSAFVQIRTDCSQRLNFVPHPQGFSNCSLTTIGTKDEEGDMT